MEFPEKLTESMDHNDHCLRIGIQRTVILDPGAVKACKLPFGDIVRKPGLQGCCYRFFESFFVKWNHICLPQFSFSYTRTSSPSLFGSLWIQETSTLWIRIDSGAACFMDSFRFQTH